MGRRQRRRPCQERICRSFVAGGLPTPFGVIRLNVNMSETSEARRAGGDVMEHPGFFERAGPFRWPRSPAPRRRTRALAPTADALIDDVRTARRRRPGHAHLLRQPQVSAAARRRPRPAPASSRRRSPTAFPPATAALVTKTPYRGFAQALALFYPTPRCSRRLRRPAAPRLSTRPPSSRRAS